MKLDMYQVKAQQTAVYQVRDGLSYCALGLAGEAGEVADIVKKVLRDDGGHLTKKAELALAKELGDVLWYVANLAGELGIPLSVIADINLTKLEDRQKRGVLGGSGDNR